MTTLLVDSSVLIKWFHAEGEAEAGEAQLIRDANQRGEIDTRIIDLALYEVGNVLLRGLGWDPDEVAGQLDDLRMICGTPLVVAPEWLHDAARLGGSHGLTFYDAVWAASAQALNLSLVSADAQLLGAGLAQSPTVVARRLGLSSS